MDQYLRQAFEFVQKLEKLDKADRQLLKRWAGSSLADSPPQAWHVFYKVLPYTVPRAMEPTYFLIATIFPLTEGSNRRTLGKSLRLAAQRGTGQQAERLLNHLLDADRASLAVWLPQTIRFLGLSRVSVHWFRLLIDILHWDTWSHQVQRKWARDFVRCGSDKKGDFAC